MVDNGTGCMTTITSACMSCYCFVQPSHDVHWTTPGIGHDKDDSSQLSYIAPCTRPKKLQVACQDVWDTWCFVRTSETRGVLWGRLRHVVFCEDVCNTWCFVRTSEIRGVLWGRLRHVVFCEDVCDTWCFVRTSETRGVLWGRLRHVVFCEDVCDTWCFVRTSETRGVLWGRLRHVVFCEDVWDTWCFVRTSETRGVLCIQSCLLWLMKGRSKTKLTGHFRQNPWFQVSFWSLLSAFLDERRFQKASYLNERKFDNSGMLVEGTFISALMGSHWWIVAGGEKYA